MTIDGNFDSDTTAMVKRGQTGLGEPATGIVALSNVVFLPGATTVDSVSAHVGDAVGSASADQRSESVGTASPRAPSSSFRPAAHSRVGEASRYTGPAPTDTSA